MSKVTSNGPVFYMAGNTTVCLLMRDGVPMARGLSIYSRMDGFDPAEGRRRAMNRAREAEGRQSDCGQILIRAPRGNDFDWFDLSLAKDAFGDFKGYYMPLLTETEKLLLEFNGRLVLRNSQKMVQIPASLLLS
jgi:hypothetical protein